MQLLDDLGYDEAWIGEHHSVGWEIISSPELFIAAAIERTRRLRLGTGVVSVSYHNPLMVADRLIQLDHQSLGRVMFGFGPGLLTTDAKMLGIDPSGTRRRLEQAVDVILRLLKGEVVSEQTDWYALQDARVQLLPYTRPHPEVAIASAFTPSGGRLAGKYGLAMLCIAASELSAFDVLAANWQIAESAASEHGMTVSREHLRLVAPMHIASTRERAKENVRFGLSRYIDYANTFQKRFDIPDGVDPVDHLIDSKYAVIGTPDDAIEMIERLYAKQGGFGTFLIMALNWADWHETQTSYEMFSRYVMPHFTGANQARVESYEWMRANRDEFNQVRDSAVRQAFQRHGAAVQEGSPFMLPGEK
jgi:limonene 1,2-monooxygenase